MASKPKNITKKTAEEVAPPPATKSSKVNERHVVQVVDAVGHTLRRTFPDLGYVLVVFDKRKPEQTQHFIGGDRAAAATAMGAVTKKLGA